MRRLKDKSSPSQPSATLDEIQANASYIVFDAGAEEEEAGDAPPRIAPKPRRISTGSRPHAAGMSRLRPPTTPHFLTRQKNRRANAWNTTTPTAIRFSSFLIKKKQNHTKTNR